MLIIANLEGKAPLGRAVTYPPLAFAVPAWWARRSDGPYPWLPDLLLLTYTALSDILGIEWTCTTELCGSTTGCISPARRASPQHWCS